jgi:hypothetical protein
MFKMPMVGTDSYCAFNATTGCPLRTSCSVGSYRKGWSCETYCAGDLLMNHTTAAMVCRHSDRLPNAWQLVGGGELSCLNLSEPPIDELLPTTLASTVGGIVVVLFVVVYALNWIFMDLMRDRAMRAYFERVPTDPAAALFFGSFGNMQVCPQNSFFGKRSGSIQSALTQALRW